MGSAAPVVGLAMQGVGLFSGGGTSYSPDPRAKYQADLQALAMATENAARQKQLLYQERDTANQLADFQREQQFWAMQGERDYYLNQLEAEYQQAAYQNEVSRMQLEMQNLGNVGQSTLGRLNTDAQYQSGVRNLNQQTAEAGLAYRTGQAQRGLQATDANAQFGISSAQNALQQQGVNLSDVGLDNQQTALNLQGQGLGLQEMSLMNQLGAGNRAFDQQSAAANIAQGQALSQADLAKQQQLNQLINTFTGNEQAANQLRSRMQAAGLNVGVQGAGLEQSANLDPRIANQQMAMQAAYGNQVGGAQLQNYLAQAGVNLGRENLAQQTGMGIQQLNNARAGLNVDRAGLSVQRAGNDLQRRGLGLDQASASYQRDSFINSLGLADQADALQNVLIPGLNQQRGLSELGLQNQLAQGGYDINDFINNIGYQMGAQGLGLEREANLQDRLASNKIVDADFQRNLAAIDALQKSQKTTNDLSLASALAQLASSQYGVLSSIGAGLSTGVPSGGGGGFNWAGLGGLLSQAAKLGSLGGGGGGKAPASTSRPLTGQSSYYRMPDGVGGI